jgi:hypothetical protein
VHDWAVDRHAAWARDYASVGEIDAALGELLDIAAIAAEFSVAGDLNRPGSRFDASQPDDREDHGLAR